MDMFSQFLLKCFNDAWSTDYIIIMMGLVIHHMSGKRFNKAIPVEVEFFF